MGIVLPQFRQVRRHQQSDKLPAMLRQILCFILLASFAGPVRAQNELADQVSAANQSLLDGDFAGAASGYAEIESELPDSAIYNYGVALYRDQKFATAAQQFQRVTASAENPLAAKARFNLGNCFYAIALADLQSAAQVASDQPAPPPDPTKAIESLESAITQYRSSLRINPSDDDARANIELAYQLLKRLKQQDQSDPQDEQEQQDEQSEQEQGENQQQNEQSGEDQQNKEQQQEGDQQSNEDQQQDSDSQQTEQEPDEGDQEQESNQASDQQDQSANDPSQSKQNQNPSDQESGDQNESESQQADNMPKDSATNTDDQGDVKDGEENRSEATEESDEQQKPTPSGELSAENQPANESENRETGEAMEEAALSDQITDEEARKLLQAIRDRDLQRRLRRRAIQRLRRVPVERDW